MTLTVLRNGRVHTAADPEATALAITDGTISWIGGEHAVGTAGRPDRVIDLAGALVVPGFVDAHVHTLDAGLALTGLDLSGTRSLAQCLQAVREYAGTHPDGVIWGHGWEDTRWPEGRPPTRAELDDAGAEHRRRDRRSGPGRNVHRSTASGSGGRASEGPRKAS